MPKVGSGKSAKHFDYDSKGEAAAERYAAKSGKKVQYTKPMPKGKGK